MFKTVKQQDNYSGTIYFINEPFFFKLSFFALMLFKDINNKIKCTRWLHVINIFLSQKIDVILKTTWPHSQDTQLSILIIQASEKQLQPMKIMIFKKLNPETEALCNTYTIRLPQHLTEKIHTQASVSKLYDPHTYVQLVLYPA